MTRNNKVLSKYCNVSGCEATSSMAVVYSMRRTKDIQKYHQWLSILGLPRNYKASMVNACQRHFPAGAPTKNNPDPDPELFNPIPKMVPIQTNSDDPNFSGFEDSNDELIGLDGKPLPSAIRPPSGSVVKLAPNATLIDINKIKKNHDFHKPIKIEEVTVMIDEKDTVKVIDWGQKNCFNNQTTESDSSKSESKSRKRPFISSWDSEVDFHDLMLASSDPNFKDFQGDSLDSTLEHMRHHRVDCNTVIMDESQGKPVYAHRSVLVAKSPYFYKYLYLKRKKNRTLHEFCKFTLPFQADYEVIDAVVSHLYTGLFECILNVDSSSVRELLTLFELKDSLGIFDQEVSKKEELEENVKRCIKMESGESETSVMVMPLEEFEDDSGPTPVIEVNDERMNSERKRKRRSYDESREEYKGRLKVSVQKIVENALNPFLGKIEELFDPSSSTFQIAQTSQHIITLWHADILLTKLFDQNDLTKFFSDVITEVHDHNNILTKNESITYDETKAYVVRSLFTHTGNPDIDEPYTRSFLDMNEEQPIEDPIQTLTVGEVKIINYNHLHSKHIPKYVHLIALYRFNIFMKRKHTKPEGNESCKDSLMPTLLEGSILNDESSNTGSNDIEDLVKSIAQEEQQFFNKSIHIPQASFQQVYIDLKRRVITDLELYVNPTFHEELIMHIIVDQIGNKDILPLTVGIFLAKGCNFCRKKECKSEDLTIAISPDNPLCPDRECIKRNLFCDICNKQMSNSKSLARHKDTVHYIEEERTTLGSFICSHCGESFTKKWKLNIHERDHEDRKLELNCRYCKKKLRGTMALKKHIAMVHETKPQFSCEFCPKIFKRRETLNVHRRIHTGEKPFRCNYCAYASETKGNLKAHVFRKHKLQLVSLNPDENQEHILPTDPDDVLDEQCHVIPEETVNSSTSDDQVMAATIVAHTLSDGSSFIITS